MKKIFIFLISVSCISYAYGQQKDDCATKVTNYIEVDQAIMKQNQLLYTTPYQLRLFIHIVATDNGSIYAVTNQAAFNTYLEGTRAFYASHNMCFSLVAVDTIYSTALFNMVVDNTADYDLLVSKLVPGCVNVFFHSTLSDMGGGSFNGNAYDIPNYFCSVRGDLIGSTNTTTMAHEMGHDFGLYHTFSKANNKSETVPRSGAQSNCTIAGDLICDTHADPNPSASQISFACVYTGSATDSLGYSYTPPVTNILAYGRYECRTVFTVGQRDRMHYFITNTASLTNTLNEDYLTISTNGTINSGIYVKASRTGLTVDPPSSMVVTGSAKAYFTAGYYVDLKPGIQFTAGAAGLTVVHMNTMCQ